MLANPCRRATRLLSLVALVPLVSACGGGSPGVDEAAVDACLSTINQLRATIGVAPYTRWADGEVCVGQEAQEDSATGSAHGAFGMCSEHAQDECPGWPGPPAMMIGGCLQAMWNEGPGTDFATHGHYINMSSTQYTKVACGFYTLPDGSVWAAQNFQ